MRIAVVDALEIVDVEQGKTQRPALGDAFVERGRQTFFHVPAIAKAGKRIGTRLPRKRVGVRQYLPVEGAQLVVLLAQRQCRSEEHTSELQSLMRSPYAVFCLKKTNISYAE